jgi:phosphoribosylformimino-5-aminoimidazole carboxamide ribotide isomerase
MSTRRFSLFRPCIDLHNGQVKQIVGGTLSDENPSDLQTNFVARYVRFCLLLDLEPLFSLSAQDFARLYKKHDLEGGHVIKLGPGNDDAALEALRAWPGPIFFHMRDQLA